MTSELKPCEMPCPKCGSAECTRRYVGVDCRVHNEDYGKCNNRFAIGQCHHYYALREHIDHVCKVCGHRWQTAPLPRPKRIKKVKPA